ncbi:MAG: hypothetical protein JWM16_2135 [Verrucomicrobiales bacterium]|nr:hypothetical protein [Verrucomicrobiales bacterium]
MKKLLGSISLSIVAMLLLNGCVVAMGNKGGENKNGTLGQQLIDLKKAKENGAMTDAEYEAQKAKLLGNK